MKNKNGAMLCGLNYNNCPEFKNLRGCENDMLLYKKRLHEIGDNWELYENVELSKSELIQKLNYMIKNYKNIWFSFSGHGTQLINFENSEHDGCDESLVMSKPDNDGYYVTDDELFEVFQQLKPGQKMFCIIDTCHSGTMLDLQYIFMKNTLEKNNNKKIQGNVICLSGCSDAQTSADVRNGDNSYGAMSNALLACVGSNGLHFVDIWFQFDDNQKMFNEVTLLNNDINIYLGSIKLNTLQECKLSTSLDCSISYGNNRTNNELTPSHGSKIPIDLDDKITVNHNDKTSTISHRKYRIRLYIIAIATTVSIGGTYIFSYLKLDTKKNNNNYDEIKKTSLRINK